VPLRDEVGKKEDIYGVWHYKHLYLRTLISKYFIRKWSKGMAELFFQHEKIPYLFDTRLLKLFRIKNKETTEIVNRKIVRKIRFNSLEIDRQKAFRLSQQIEY